MFKSLFKNKAQQVKIFSVCQGQMIKQADIVDPVFAKGMMGPAYALKPKANLVMAPIKGKVEMIFPTHHALGLSTPQGIECIVHIGVDTVNLKGEGFKPLVEVGQEVDQSIALVEVDFDLIRQKGYHDEIIVAFQNTKSFHIDEVLADVKASQEVGYCE